jgi:hypothetical protein
MSMITVSVFGSIVLDYRRALSVNDRANKQEMMADRATQPQARSTIYFSREICRNLILAYARMRWKYNRAS